MAKQALIHTDSKCLIGWAEDIDYTLLEPDTYRPAEHTIITDPFTLPGNWAHSAWHWNDTTSEFDETTAHWNRSGGAVTPENATDNLILLNALGLGIALPERMFHMQGNSAVMRIDRDTNSPAVQLHRFPAGDFSSAPLKGFLFGVDAVGADDGTFFISDIHQALSGGGDKRLLIDKDGKIAFGSQIPVVGLHMRSGQILIDTSSYPFATSKSNSQGVAWSAAQPARTPGLIFQALAQDRPEISWYRGSRGYPEFSIRQHPTNDKGAEIYSGGGTAPPIMTMAFNLGKVGIGTNNPGLPLEVRNADDNLGFFFDSRAQAQGVGGGIAFGAKYTDAGDEAMTGRVGTKKTNGTSGHVGFDMVFETQNDVGSMTERAIFTSDGKCGIGDIIPTRELDVNGAARTRGKQYIDDDAEVSGNIGAGKSSPTHRIDAYVNRTVGIVRSGKFQVDGNHVDARGLYVIAGEDSESGTNYWFEAYDGDGGTNTGGLRSVAGVFDVYDASDRRLKKNIKNTKIVGKDMICRLKIRDFEWKKNPGRRVTGLIAQETRKICPDAVGDPDPATKMYGVSRSTLIPLLIKHNQELQRELDVLTMRVVKLEKTG